MSDTTTTTRPTFHCPLAGCDFTLEAVKADAAEAFKIAQRLGGREAAHRAAQQAHVNAAWKTQQKFKAHLRKHDPLEWVTQLVDALEQVAALQEVRRRLDELEGDVRSADFDEWGNPRHAITDAELAGDEPPKSTAERAAAAEVDPDELHPSRAWADALGYMIQDPDGWDRTDLAKSFAEPITRAEFERRAAASTVKRVPVIDANVIPAGPGRFA